MDLCGESLIGAPRSAVWAALNDPAVLARCLGAEILSRSAVDGAARFEGAMSGAQGTRFAVGVTLTVIDTPNRCVLTGEGEGGTVTGRVEVALADAGLAGGDTRLDYAVDASVGGKLAQFGARHTEEVARNYAETFVGRFKAELEAPAPASPSVDAPPATDKPSVTPVVVDGPVDDARALHDSRQRSGLTPLIWGGLLILAVIAVLFWELR